MNTEDDLEIVGFDNTESGIAEIDRWTALAASTLTGESVTTGRLDVIFVDDEEMAELNQTHMGHPGPTDVLSFPLDGTADHADGGEEPGCGDDGEEGDDIFARLPGDDQDLPRHLGDIVVCPTVAEKQASGHAGSFDAEMTLLIIHGTLHILGHDHAEPEETELMQGRERVHMAAAGFDHPRWGATR